MVKKHYRKKNKKAKVSKATKLYVKKALDSKVEDKWMFYAATTNIDNTATYVCLNGMTQGTSVGTRLGAAVNIKSVKLNLHFSQTGTGINIAQRVRFMLVCDRQADGGMIDLTNLLCSTTAGATYGSPLNPAGYKRYKVLWETQRNLQVHGGATDLAEQSTIHRTIKKHFRTQFTASGNTGTYADINTNSLWLIAMCNVASPNGCAVNYQIRVMYEDA